MIRWIALSLVLSVAGCSPSTAVKLLTGGGPNVAANGQGGRTNVQAIGQTAVTDQKIVRPQARSIEQSAGETGVRAEAVQSVTVHNEAPPWVWIIAILAVGMAGAALADEIRDRMARRGVK
ncbi:hypothetical protein TG4357_02642 [Thalassovita gelatinovora]|uniref:Uncharacterized protein n=1 Tax=Thalassovita gelatinovora TaxID=53501 RepID=A0A0N7LVN5_THAGE|nr:bacteriophage spanin2 family protein [Thalassovita gelatinovora]QIZ79768.1 bacteriophage spanin2 family protein [Thalassovita gelatinovora]CUH66794.1 hypothetical protein TG4357_02642 [Thalassovita gelatinovora]SEQ42877.1 hypothetical protein SAMN04488043_105179 [Thalassovita gelatinovora]